MPQEIHSITGGVHAVAISKGRIKDTNLNCQSPANQALPVLSCFLSRGFCLNISSLLITGFSRKAFSGVTGYFFLTRDGFLQISVVSMV
jgi:hypothetical protein